MGAEAGMSVCIKKKSIAEFYLHLAARGLENTRAEKSVGAMLHSVLPCVLGT